MTFSLIFSASQLRSVAGADFGLGSYPQLKSFACLLAKAGFQGNLYEMPCQLKSPTIASPFSLSSGFALSLDELDLFQIPEMEFCPAFQHQLEALKVQHDLNFHASDAVNYSFKRSLIPWALEELFPSFAKRSVEREQRYQDFLTKSHYWLEDFTLYEALKAEGSQLLKKEFCKGKSKVKLLKETEKRREFYSYTQFIAFEQRLDWVNWAREQGLSLMLNLPFGVERKSADVFFHPEVFLADLQVGCSPEPYNGYPEQAWGVAAYKECSAGLQEYLLARLEWLKNFGHGIFLDHLVGWCGQYVLPISLDPEVESPQGEFLTTIEAERIQNILWFLRLVASSGLEIVGEIAGDRERVQATNKAIKQLEGEGVLIFSMRIPRWEVQEEAQGGTGKLMSLQSYPKGSLCMIETHDTSTLLQYLCNQKGEAREFETTENILAFAHQVLAWPLLPEEVPLTLDSLLTEGYSKVMEEVLLRLVAANPSQEVACSYGGLVAALLPTGQSLALSSNINIQPGTSGLVGNERLNWSLFNPEIEKLSKLQSFFTKSHRKRAQFPALLHLLEREEGKPTCMLGEIKGNKVLWKNRQGKWALAPKQAKAKWELVMHNPWEGEIQGMLNMDWLSTSLQQGGKVAESLLLRDLENQEEYRYPLAMLMQEGLYYHLQAGQKHHFLLYLT